MSQATQPVVIGLSGGLGNQMFQYAAGRALSLRLGVPLHLDLSWFFGRKDRRYALAPFGISGVPSERNLLLPDLFKSWESKFARRYATKRMGVPIFRERHFHFDSAFERLSAPVYLEGYWQSEFYFREIASMLRLEFTLLEPLPTACAALREAITSCNAICVHVRRGDYLSNYIASKTHCICPIDYYQNGVNELIQGLENPHCFLFSDDTAWVREFLNLNCSMTVVDVNSSADAHLDLMLMAECRHFLIANSSLSWWAAWLGSYAAKKVIAPKHWFLTPEKDTRDLLPDSWERR
jgi:Glycosyl transferase family 11